MTIRSYRQYWKHAFLDLLYPPICLSCNRPLNDRPIETFICLDCKNDLQPVSADFAQINILDRLEPCLIDEARIAFRFNEVIRNLIHPLKYQKMPLVGQYLGRISGIITEDLDILAAVPLHKMRLKERGYNQSDCIARGIIQSSPSTLLEPNLIYRHKATSSQTRLSRHEREDNLADAFVLDMDIDLKGKSIGIVDDVITTGTTLNECARLLKSAGAGKVVAIALAAPVKAVEIISLDEAGEEKDWL